MFILRFFIQIHLFFRAWAGGIVKYIYYICIIKCDYALWSRALCAEESIGLAVKHNVMHLVNKK